MRLSNAFYRTKKQAPADEITKNAQLLSRAGYIHKEVAGVYTFLPLGFKVIENIVDIIRQEMEAVGGQEISLTALQDPEVWQKSNRWDDQAMDNWFKTKLKNDRQLGLATTHEEPIARMMSNHVSSYKDLPQLVFQFQTKFRNELRAKSGIMRGREFLMKDLYSFARSDEEHEEIYDQLKKAYVKVFARLGIGEETFVTFASGRPFTEFSHEFQTVCEAGEDIIFLDRSKGVAINKEVYSDEVVQDLGLNTDQLEEVKAAEVGNIFSLGAKYAEAEGLMFTDEKGQSKPVVMGSYGIGPARIMGVIVELMADQAGLIWPEAIAPAQVHLIGLGESEEVTKKADEMYQLLMNKTTVLYDDRDLSAGQKLADADLLGMPLRIVVSAKSLAAGGVEVKNRAEEQVEIRPADLNWFS